jgi:hypothetical protein
MLGWKHFLQGKLLPDWMDIINNERAQLGLPPNLRVVPLLMMALITTTLNLWRNHYEFMHGGIHIEKIVKQRRIIIKQVEDLKTHGQNLGRKGRDHMSGAPAKTAQFRVIRAWIRTSQAFFGRLTKDRSVFRSIA